MGNKKCRIYAACGVLQTPNSIIFVRKNNCLYKNICYINSYLSRNLNDRMRMVDKREICYIISSKNELFKIERNER